MNIVSEKLLTGERAMFKAHDVEIRNSVFADGESPLKESKNLSVKDTIFRWKYPMWYSNNITAENITLVDTARSGIWYTNNINIKNSTIQAPKTFRRGHDISLEQVVLSDAEETMWSCENISLENVQINGNYFAKDSKNIKANNINITGNYAFDGAENIEISNSRLISKDAFWNCKNVVVKNCTIVGEYLAWNSENITFIDCVIESNQGLCYMKDVKMVNCKLINTDLAFEYVENVDAEINSSILSVKNPISGVIKAQSIDEIIFDDENIDKNATQIILTKKLELVG